MATSTRAPLLPPRPPSAGRLLVWAALALLGGVLGCARHEEAPPPKLAAQVEGHWQQPIVRASRLAPCGHGHHAWAWSPGRPGLWLVDAEGASRELAPEVFRPRFEIISVIPTAEASRAWVHVVTFNPEGLLVQDSRPEQLEHWVFLVDHQGLVARGEPVLEGTPAALENYRLVPSENRQRLWVVAPSHRALQSVDAQGSVRTVELGSAQKWSWSLVNRLLPLGDGQQGWLALNEGLSFLDLKASGNPLGPNLLPARLVQDIHPTPEPGTAWVLTQRDFASPLQLFLLRRSEAKKPPAPLLGGAQVLHFSARPGGAQAWVVLAETPQNPTRRLLLLDATGRPVSTSPQEVVAREPRLAEAPDGDTWLRDDERLLLLDAAGNPVADKEGLEWLPSAELVPLPGRRAWAMTQRGTLFLVEATKGGRLNLGVPLSIGHRGLVPVGWSAQGGWLLSEGNTTLHQLTFEQGEWKGGRRLTRGQISGVFPIPGSPRAWVADLPRSHILGPASDVRGVVLGFKGGGRLEFRAGQEPRAHGTLLAGATLEHLELDWPGRKDAEQSGHPVQVEVFNEDDEGKRVADGILPLDAPADRLRWSDVPSFITHPYRVVLTHQVEDGSHFTVTFRNVPFEVPLLERVWVRTALGCLAVTLLVFLPMLLLRPSDRTRRWLPLVGYTVSLAGAGGGELLGRLEALRIHLPAFVGVVGAELLGCAALGLLSPAVFRRLIFTHPFSWLAPLLLHLPAFRRRFFRAYVQRVRTRVDIDSDRANGEQYVELSSHVTEQPRPGTPPTTTESTAEGLRDLLLSKHLHVFIQCAGGRGKSALLRQLVRLSLERFEQRPDSPLPVLIDPSAEDLEKAAKETLEELGLPEALRDALLEAGDFFLVLDGLTESRLTPERLRRYVERDVGASAPLLLTARPNEEFQAALEHAGRWARVEPHRLDDTTLPRFQRAYQGLATEALPPTLPAPLLRICRGGGTEGSYVPLLVRLALKFGGADVDSIIGLYRAVFAGLLKAPDEQATSRALEFAQGLCLKVYWEQRSRLIVFRDHPQREQLEGLLEAGLLVPVGGGSAPGGPTHVRFFHDSMQSYLTARALYARDVFQPAWDCLWRAAGEPAFAREASDLLVGAGSELFQMCAYVFGNDARLRNELMRHLQLCADANDDTLNKESILLAAPEAMRDALRERGRGMGPGPLLRDASLACLEHAGGESLYLLYARIAQLAWPWTVPATASAEGARSA